MCGGVKRCWLPPRVKAAAPGSQEGHKKETIDSALVFLRGQRQVGDD